MLLERVILSRTYFVQQDGRSKMKYGKAVDEIEDKVKEFTFDIKNQF